MIKQKCFKPKSQISSSPKQMSKMYYNLSHYILVLLFTCYLPTELASLPNKEFSSRSIFQALKLSFMRPKRQLFREDIPHNRPLTGNHYANEHGFPLPGRWQDGTRNMYAPNANLPPPHQAYIDMLDGARKGRYQQGIVVPSVGSENNDEFFKDSEFNDHNNNGGGSDFGEDYNGGFGDDHNEGQMHDEEYEPNYDYGGMSNFKGQSHTHQPKAPVVPYSPPLDHVNVQVYGNDNHHQQHQEKRPHEEPKAIVHFHPIQYGNILDIPEKKPILPQIYPEPHKATPVHHHIHHHQNQNHHNQNQQSLGYGPPNHVRGPILTLGQGEGGFVPSKPIFESHVPVNNHIHNNNNNDHYQEHHPHPYRFQPIKALEHDPPVAIPILAQFHTAKPIQITKLKEPVHIYNINNHNNYGPPGRGHHHHHTPRHSRHPKFFHHFQRHPKYPPARQHYHPNWYYSK